MDDRLYPGPIAYSGIDDDLLDEKVREFIGESVFFDSYTRLEKIFIVSILNVLIGNSIDPSDPGTIFVFSTTKGNIDLLENHRKSLFEPEKIHLWRMAEMITQFFGNPNKPYIISNACISGSAAIMAASRLIASGRYDHAVVTGGDIISEFVVSGFQSFQALSPEPCKPFDVNRDGLSLGEGCGTVILTADAHNIIHHHPVEYLGGAITNDANHISGPSRDGQGLYLAITAAMKEAGVSSEDIDFISAHGTATPYNDEMESLALNRAGLSHVPVNSFKGYIGHTLGAAGVIETILSAFSMRNNILFKSAGYSENGVSMPLNIITDNINKPVKRILKTASGFGGCNAAIVIGN
jgi:3-oxoacyl-[acyl-carrier-protein] synthase-1